MIGFREDFGTALVAMGKGDSAVKLDGIHLTMIGRAGPGDFVATTELNLEQEYIASFEFDDARLAQLLALLPPRVVQFIERNFAGPVGVPAIVNFPVGAVVIGTNTVLGEMRQAPDEVYVPLVVQDFFAPGPYLALSVGPRAPASSNGATDAAGADATGDVAASTSSTGKKRPKKSR